MAIPTNKIFLRSPYWVSVTDTDLDYVVLDVRVWKGDKTSDRPSLPTYRQRATALSENKVSFNISDLARDFVEVGFNGSLDSNAVWVEYSVVKYDTDGNASADPVVQLAGFDGFGYFEDNVNIQYDGDIWITSDMITAAQETTMLIPVNTQYLTGWRKYYTPGNPLGPNYILFDSASGLTPTDDSNDLIDYISNTNGTFYATRITFDFDNGSTTYSRTVDIKYAPCSKWPVNNVYFVNKLGAVQNVHFIGKSNVSMQTESDTYTRNLLVAGSYDSNRHQIYTLNKNGKIRLNMNTGWVLEEDGDTFTEMMLSEQVWILLDKDTLGIGWSGKQSNQFVLPVQVESREQLIKNRLNDKLINYEFSFMAAADRVNTVK